ncbi:MAG: thrombospondin type 3 repeat-containing protein [bacterium]
MTKHFNFKIFFLLCFSCFFTVTDNANAASLASELSGKILLQVEQHGEAWYVNPANEKRYFMGRPNDAFNLMRTLGIGISNNDLSKIQIANENLQGSDNDQDGLSNMIEDSLGTNKNIKDTDGDGYTDKEELLSGNNPNGAGNINIDNNFSEKQKGKILLQVEQHGEAWYVNPNDRKRYFLGRPDDAFRIMRNLGLGITDENLNKIKSSDDGSFIQILFPNNDVIIYEQPFYVTGRISDDCDKIVATAKNTEHNINDVYTLQNYHRGNTTFSYGIQHKWNNLDVGKNEYKITAFCDDGKREATISIFFEAGGGTEMGKPVIYLYPKAEQQVFVLPQPENGVTISEPELEDGWNVTAYPDGTIVDQLENVWPYLFWEGYSALKTPKEGFLVHQKDLNSLFDDKLSHLGLIKKEIADFKEYWLKQLNEDKYYFISFVPQSELDKHAPILVDPKPDTVIRVFFDYQVLDTPIDFTEQMLEKGPERNGFTLIEWGGRLY